MTGADNGDLAAALAHDPHTVLGVHAVGRGAVARAMRPDAERVRLLRPRCKPVELAPTSSSGLFEVRLPRSAPPAEYRFEVTRPGGESFELDDPYAFLPTLGEIDLYLIGEGRHERLYDVLGAHDFELRGIVGTAFAVWAPNAQAVSVVGDFNHWDGRFHPMRSLDSSGVWELFVPGVEPGTRYKFEVRGRDGRIVLHADPFARQTEIPPLNASVVHESIHGWTDHDWLESRAAGDPWKQPMSIYEVHLGSWRRGRSYTELADELGSYVRELGFTHVELMPIMEHPFAGSWGYQVTGFFAPTSRFGDPDEFRGFVDSLHRQGIGVILDWVPAHFPRDEWALARFDGTALYEHEDPRRGAHPDWGTLVFNLGRTEVRNFLTASALYWLLECHADGLRVDAVASMLYLDYSRKEGEWIPNEYGGREDLDSIGFLRELNELVHSRAPGMITAAEESTAWPGVSRPAHLGGLGFGFKWNMGWMHDTLGYFAYDPIHRSYHHNELTFSMIYAFNENFILPLSHDEVVHGKGSLLAKMPGDRWQKFANLRALYAYMWAHPGKKLLFMGGELAQEWEWNHDGELDWGALNRPEHGGVQALVRDLNRLYRAEPALYELDFEPAGFRWLEANDAAQNIVAFLRVAADGSSYVACVANLSPVPREGIRLGLPCGGRWREALNSDASIYGGTDVGNGGSVEAEDIPWQGHSWSAKLTLPPLGVLWLVPET
ncbi:MAG TPA: 1,4-alpha-glucan branching protein GlgB [Gaiellaceae bacterium]|nr:1,4-alpha-glucan branching protein GlgB [Gaiellaceae bacterium]